MVLMAGGPVIFCVFAVLPKSARMAVAAGAAGLALWAFHELLPPVTGSDPAGNAMASGYRALAFYSAIWGCLAAFVMNVLWLRYPDLVARRGVRVTVYAVLFPVSAALFLLVLI